MAITESEYSLMLATVERIKKRYDGRPPPAGSDDAERLELFSIKIRWYEWERTNPPAGSKPPEADRMYALLDRVFTPTPVVTKTAVPPRSESPPKTPTPRPR